MRTESRRIEQRMRLHAEDVFHPDFESNAIRRATAGGRRDNNLTRNQVRKDVARKGMQKPPQKKHSGVHAHVVSKDT